MSPQFVDWNADGHIDIVAGTYDGSPHVAFGTTDGFLQPVDILDRDGARIVLNQFWNYDSKKWDETARCDPAGGAPAKGHCTSAWAMDWDRDGDLDLLLGDHENGHVYLRRNEGAPATAQFAPKNELVAAAGGPIRVDKVATLRIVDGDGDGVPDLLIGTMGDSYGAGPGGGVFLFPGIADAGAARFGEPVTLVAPSPKGATDPTRPDAGLYMDLADHDGDGDLDLIVGGYSMWHPPAPELTDAQQEQLAALKAERDGLQARSRKIYQEIGAGLEQLGADEQRAERARRSKERAAELKQITEPLRELTAAIGKLEPSQQRQSFVWLYENLAHGAAADAPGGR
jgi:hypothetical protein